MSTVRELSASISQLQERMDSQLKDSADVGALRRTAVALHAAQCPACNDGGLCPFPGEERATDNEEKLWQLPEHAFWWRFAAVSIYNGTTNATQKQ